MRKSVRATEGSARMEHTHISRPQQPERAILIGAFAGWNDAASAATWAVKFLVNQWDAEPFAEIDPDEFYDFSESRPTTRISGGALKRFSWPSNRYYIHRASEDEERPRDVILFIGEEPHLRWKTFARELVTYSRQLHVEEIALLGVFSAEAPHTAPVQISGAASRAATLRRMDALGVDRATYSGPTGILTAVQDIARRENMSTTSLWAGAPHYVAASPNLPVAEALLRTLNQLYHLDLSLKDLARAAQRFNTRVSNLVAADPDVTAYVHDLEQKAQHAEAGEDVDGEGFNPDLSGIHNISRLGELPSPEQAILDVEAYLRRRREQNGTDDAE